MIILGISYETHENSVALIEDGRILFAAAEERYSRLKMDTSVPVLAMKECFHVTGKTPKDVDIVALSGYPPLKNWFYYAKSFCQQKFFTGFKDMFTFRCTEGSREIVLRWLPAFLINLMLCTGMPQFIYIYALRILKIKAALKGFKGKTIFVDHHDCHAAGACFTSGLNEALSIVAEGFDWQASLVIDEFRSGKLTKVSESPWPHSPGYFYCLITTILGFNYLRHSGKITGLAAFGNPKIAYDKVAKLMWADGTMVKVSPLVYTLNQEYLLSGKMPKYFEVYTREDLAAAFQRRLEDVLIDIVKAAVKKTGIKKIVLSGGVAANVLMNQRLHDIKGIEEVFIHPAMSDAGQAFGAAIFAYNQKLVEEGRSLASQKLNDVYLGTGYSNKTIEDALVKIGLKYKYFENIELEIARLLSEKKIVARFNGRMEYGPRALGNRSILCHAGDKTINDWLNKRLDRTEFMPFAPSVLEEDKELYFKNVKGAEYTAEFMTITFDSTERMKRECPAVVHIDGTARPHFVNPSNNHSYYRVIKEYKKLTGISVILNTSFNMHEEPIVCSPDDAIRSFLRGHLDYLAIGDYLVKNE
jgi:carbamoyltransferase